MIVVVPAFAGGLYLALKARRRLSTLEPRPMVKASQVAALAAMGSARCDLTGIARAGERGLLTAPISDRSCVWHRVSLQAIHLDDDGDDLGKPADVLSEDSSQAPIVLKEQDGVVVVDMRAAEVMCDQSSVVPVDRHSLDGIEAALSAGYDPNTRFERVEWLIADGSELFVSGRPVSVGDQVGIGLPNDGPLTVATDSEAVEALTAMEEERMGRALMVSTGVAAVAGLIFS